MAEPAVQKKRRGRPPNAASPKLATADATIGRTVWQLMAWGYALGRGRNGMAVVVADAAKAILGRTDAAGGALSGDGIERIYKSWMLSAKSGWVRQGTTLPLGRPWRSIKSSTRVAHRRNGYVLEDLRPPGALHQLVSALMRNGGRWPYRGNFGDAGDPEPTTKFEAESDGLSPAPRLIFPSDPEDDKTG